MESAKLVDAKILLGAQAHTELTDVIDITRKIHYIFQFHANISISSNAFAIARMPCGLATA